MRLTVNNSNSVIHDLSLEQYKSLRKELSYKVPGSYYTQDPNGGVRYLITKKGEFASGLLTRVQTWARLNKIMLTIEDQRRVPKSKPGTFVLSWK